MQSVKDSKLVYFNDTVFTREKYGYVPGFGIASADSVFHWAKTYIRGNAVVVYIDSVHCPVAIRYAVGEQPDPVDLYSRNGLPVVPFRTDGWKGTTFGKTFSFKE